MDRALRVLPFALLLACTTSGATTEGTTPPTTTPECPDVGGGAGLDAQLVQTATTATTVHKMKIRVDAKGAVTKQSVYHDDEAAIPEPVKALASERFPKGKVMHYESELYADRGRVYEVEVDDGGTRCEVAATAEGQELYTECRFDPASLSDAAKATVEGIAPGGKILEVESKSGPEMAEELWIEVEHAGGELYLRLSADGALEQAWRRVPGIVEIPLATGG